MSVDCVEELNLSGASLIDRPPRRSKRHSHSSLRDDPSLPSSADSSHDMRDEGHSAKKRKEAARPPLADISNRHPSLPSTAPRHHPALLSHLHHADDCEVDVVDVSVESCEEACHARCGMDTTEDDEDVHRRCNSSSSSSLDEDELLFSASKCRPHLEEAKLQLTMPPCTSSLQRALPQPAVALSQSHQPLPPHHPVLHPRSQSSSSSSASSSTSTSSSSSSPFSSASSASSVSTPSPLPSLFSPPSSLFHSCLPEYGPTLLAYLLHCDVRHLANPRYMTCTQHDLSFAMRGILIDWLLEVCQEYSLHPHTLLLAVSYIDRFLSAIPLDRSRLQLLGVSALLLAAKYWEIRPPLIDDFVYISDNTYTRDEVVAMERAVLGALRWEVGGCSAWDFARFLVWESGGVGAMEEWMAAMMMEMMLMEADWVGCRCSVVGGSAVALGRWALYQGPGAGWREGWQGWHRAVGFGAREVEGCIGVMLRLWKRMKEQMKAMKAASAQQPAGAAAPPLLMKGIINKYSKAQYGAVALLPFKQGSPFDC